MVITDLIQIFNSLPTFSLADLCKVVHRYFVQQNCNIYIYIYVCKFSLFLDVNNFSLVEQFLHNFPIESIECKHISLLEIDIIKLFFILLFFRIKCSKPGIWGVKKRYQTVDEAELALASLLNLILTTHLPKL